MRLNSLNSQEEEKKEEDYYNNAIIYSNFQLKKLNKWIPPIRWNLIDKRNLLCDICYLPITYCNKVDCMCSICNVVAHISCLNNIQRNKSYRNSWICQYCDEDIKISKEKYLETRTKHTLEETTHIAQILIAKTWKRYKYRKKFMNVVQLVIRIQALLRRVKLKSNLLSYRKSLRRPLQIVIEKCTALTITDSVTQSQIFDPYVVITVAQSNVFNSGSYSIRTKCLKKQNNPVYSESFLLPGVTGHQVIVLTAIDHGIHQDEYIGQTVIDLSDKSLWNRGGSLSLFLRLPEYHIKNNGSDYKMKNSFRPTGVIEVKVKPCLSMNDWCGWMFAPSLENLAIAFRRVRKKSEVFSESSGYYGENLGYEPKIESKKLWIVLSGGKLFIHNTEDSLCKFIIELNKTTLEVTTRMRLHKFTISMKDIPSLHFQVLDACDNLNWKYSFLSAYESSKQNATNLPSLVEEVRSLKKQTRLLNNHNLQHLDTNLDDSLRLSSNPNSNHNSNHNSPSHSPINSITSTSNTMIPIKPDLSTRPSNSIVRKGSQYVSNLSPTSMSPSSMKLQSSFFSSSTSESLTKLNFETNNTGSNLKKSITSQESLVHQPSGHLLSHMSIKSILNLNNSSAEINSPEIFTSIYENRIVLTSSLNLGLKMILNPSY